MVSTADNDWIPYLVRHLPTTLELQTTNPFIQDYSTYLIFAQIVFNTVLLCYPILILYDRKFCDLFH